MNYTLDDIYGSGIMGPMATNDSPTTNPYEDYLAGNLGGPSAPPPAPIDTPVDAPAALPGPTASFVPPKTVSQSEGTSTSESQSGINFDTLGRLEKGSSIIDKRVAKEMAPIDAELARQQEEQTRIAGNQGNVIKGVSAIDQQKAQISAEHDVEQAKLVDQYNNDLGTIQAEGQKRVQAAMDTHQKMMQEYTTLQVDPGMMWKNMTGGEKLGSGLSVFASAFLGAKGIDTPVMAMLDKAIDRNIDAQLQNINQKGRALDQQGKLVQMVREQSSSDYEAKLRLKSMALESGKYHLAAQFSQFDSKLAELKGQEMLNNLDQAQLKNSQELFKVRSDAESQITNQQISIRGQELQAAQAAAARAESRRQFDLTRQDAQNAAQGNQMKELAANSIFDTSEGATRGFFFKDGITDKEREMVRDKFASNAELTSILKEAAEISKAAYRGPGESYLTDVQKARADQLAAYATKILQKEFSGTASSDQEGKVFVNMLAPDSLLNQAKFKELSAQLTQLRQSSMNQKVGQYLTDMPDDVNAMLRSKGLGPATAPQDVIGTNRIGEGGWGEPIGTAAAATIDAKPEITTENQKFFDTANSDKAYKETAKLSEPEAEIVARFYEADPDTTAATYNSNMVRREKSTSVGKKQIIGLVQNANAGDKEAINYLVKLANEKSGLRGEEVGQTENAKFAKFVLDDFNLLGNKAPEVVGQSYSPEFLQKRLDAGDALLNRK